MKLKEKIQKLLFGKKDSKQLSENPNSSRFTYINNEEAIRLTHLKEGKVWYLGDEDELLNYYTGEMIFGFNENPIYNRNDRQFFWSIASMEGMVKRVHSGLGNAIITTLVNAVGSPTITSEDLAIQNDLETILYENDFVNILNQQQLPFTLAEGYGAFKIVVDTEISSVPIIQYYEGEDVNFKFKCGKITGVVFRDYYSYNNKNYVLIETRELEHGVSKIKYELFLLKSADEITPVELSEVPELAGLQNVDLQINKLLAVPSVIFFDALNKGYGRSILAGKYGLLDALDEALSQQNQTVRVSTPVEYYNPDVLHRNSNGEPQMPKIYNRQYVQKVGGYPDGDGNIDSDIQTTQPSLNFAQYTEVASAIRDNILTGILSPATMGIDVARKDNADAQREKEKITTMTRNNIIDRQEKIVKQLCELCLMFYDYMRTGVIDVNKDYKLTVKFDEFANPCFEEEIQVLGQAWSNGQISTQKYVELLWGDKLSEEDKQKEIEYLDNNKQQDTMGFNEVGDENVFGENNFGQEEATQPTDEFEE